ncbi:hypothetical protein BGZ52_001611 [Haplosporangium bisporale]|nr:hypothetical protein BGZ52_001611 [Haplosporangium bisporale]
MAQEEREAYDDNEDEIEDDNETDSMDNDANNVTELMQEGQLPPADASKASIPHHKVLEMGRSAIVFEPTRFINLPRPAGAIRKEDSVEKDGKKEEAPKIAKHMPTEKEQDKAERQGTFELSRMPDPVSELEQWIEQTFN